MAGSANFSKLFSPSIYVVDKYTFIRHLLGTMPKMIYKPYTPDMLESLVDRLERLSGRIRAIAAWMEEEELEEMEITNSKSMLLGIEHAEAFGQAAERARDNYRLGAEE